MSPIDVFSLLIEEIEHQSNTGDFSDDGEEACID
jgi:hypothetical protein